MRSIKSRLEALEAKLGTEPLLLIIRDLRGELEDLPVLGYESGEWGCEPIVTLRKEGESDEDLLERAKATARLSPNGACMVLEQIRVYPRPRWNTRPPAEEARL
jgi:hypothetical protein